MVKPVIYVSATPGPYELDHAKARVIEQIIRPTGLMDPLIDVRPAKGRWTICWPKCGRRRRGATVYW